MWLILVTIWLFIVALDHLLHTLAYSKESWLKLSRSCGLHISLFQIRIRGSCLNRHMNQLSPLFAKVFRVWFSLGAVFGVLLMVISPIILGTALLGVNIASNFQTSLTFSNLEADVMIPSFSGAVQSSTLNPLIPGVTVPIFHIVYLFLVLLLSGIVHEMGHALSAASESVKVETSGCFLALLYPGAFVELHSGLLAIIRPVQQLRVFCAGIWHNFILALVALFLLFNLSSKLVSCKSVLDAHWVQLFYRLSTPSERGPM